MNSSRPFIFKSSCPFINPLVTVPRAPIIIGINITFMCHSFFTSLSRSRYLFFFSLSFNFTLWSARTAKSTILQAYYYYYYYLLVRVFHIALADGLALEWQQVSSSLQDSSQYFAVLNNVVVWMVSTCPPTSKSSSPFSNSLVTVPNAPITIGMIVTCMFHCFFNSLARSRYLSFYSHSFSFILWSAKTVRSTILQVLFFCWLS